jgi:hypothetical protein
MDAKLSGVSTNKFFVVGILSTMYNKILLDLKMFD